MGELDEIENEIKSKASNVDRLLVPAVASFSRPVKDIDTQIQALIDKRKEWVDHFRLCFSAAYKKNVKTPLHKKRKLGDDAQPSKQFEKQKLMTDIQVVKRLRGNDAVASINSGFQSLNL